MADTMLTDNTMLETSATDIRVFGKWSGADVQISDMSLEVKIMPNPIQKKKDKLFSLGLYPRCKKAEISSTFSWSLSSKTFPKSFMSNC